MSKKEFREAVRAVGFDAEAEDLDALFSEMDSDGSGEIDFKELERSMRRK